MALAFGTLTAGGSVVTAPYFRTPRLDIRPFTSFDVAPFTAYRSDPQVARYQSWSNFDLEQGLELVDQMRDLELGSPGSWYQLALEDRARRLLVGDLACKVDACEHREMEIGFTIAPDEQRRGYAREAVEGLLHHAFTAMGMHRVTAVTDERNTASAGLLTRVGMRREGHLIENVFFKGAWGSEFLFAKLAREHDSRPAHPYPRRHTAPTQADES